MLVKIKTTLSAIVGIAWILLVLQRGNLILSGKCELHSVCDLGLVLVIGLLGLAVTLELIISPESAALYVLNKKIRGRRTSTSKARFVGVFGTIIMLYPLYWSVTQLLGLNP